jgi:hypothetical protein
MITTKQFEMLERRGRELWIYCRDDEFTGRSRGFARFSKGSGIIGRIMLMNM